MDKINELQENIKNAEGKYQQAIAASQFAFENAVKYDRRSTSLLVTGKSKAAAVCKGVTDIAELIEMGKEYGITCYLKDVFKDTEAVLENEKNLAASNLQFAKDALESFNQKIAAYEKLKKEYAEIDAKVKRLGFGNLYETEMTHYKSTKIKLEDIAQQIDRLDDCQHFLAELEAVKMLYARGNS